MDANSMKGPGLLFVQSAIVRDDLLDEQAFMHWYDSDHIAEILETSGVDAALRWKHVRLGAETDTPARPYLSIYPLEDLAFLLTDEFRNIRVTSPLLPGSGLCYDLAAFDVGVFGLKQLSDQKARRPGQTRALIVEQIETADPTALDAWYRNEVLPALAAGTTTATRTTVTGTTNASELSGYLCSACYDLRYARSNDESRRFKGLPSDNTPTAPRASWLAVHEFAALPPLDTLAALQDATPMGRAIKAAASTWLVDEYDLAKTHGTGTMFHDRTL